MNKFGYEAPQNHIDELRKEYLKKKRDKIKKYKDPVNQKISPVKYDDKVKEREDKTTQTPITGLPASFIPAPFSGGYGVGLGSIKGFTKRAQSFKDMFEPWKDPEEVFQSEEFTEGLDDFAEGLSSPIEKAVSNERLRELIEQYLGFPYLKSLERINKNKIDKGDEKLITSFEEAQQVYPFDQAFMKDRQYPDSEQFYTIWSALTDPINRSSTFAGEVQDMIAKYPKWLENGIQKSIDERAPSAEELNQMFKFEKLRSYNLKEADRKLTFGLDMDDVLVEIHEPLLEIARKYVDIPEDIAWSYRTLKEMPGVSDEVQDKVFSEVDTDFLVNLQPIPGAVEAVNKLYDEGHRIVIITARKKGWDEGTEKWFDRVGMKYHELYTDTSHDKGLYAEQEGVDIFVDDTIKHCSKVAERGIPVYRFDTVWEDREDFPIISSWDQILNMVGLNKEGSIRGLTSMAAPRWTPAQEDRLKQLYIKWRDRGYPHHIIYKAAAHLLGRSFLAVKQKLESMYNCDEQLGEMKYERWSKDKIDHMIQELYKSNMPVSRLGLPATLMYQITNHSFPKADTRGFELFYDSFDHAIAENILMVGCERDGDCLREDRPIATLDQALQYYRRKEKQAHSWTKPEIVALFRDAHAAGLPLTHSFFKQHPEIYKPLLGVGRSLEGLRDCVRRNGYTWSDLVVEAAPEYIDLYSDEGRLKHSTEEMRIRRFLELNQVPFRVATIQDKYEVTPELQELGYRNFIPDFFILDDEGNTKAIVEVFGSVADSQAANTSEIYREKKSVKEQFYQNLPYDFIGINNNADGIDLTDDILQSKFSKYLTN